MLLIAVGVFVLVLVAVLVPYWTLIVHPEEQSERALRKRLKDKRSRQGLLIAPLTKAREELSKIPGFGTTLARWTHAVDPLQRLLDQSGTKLTVGAVILFCAFLFIIAALGTLLLTPSFVAAAIAAVLAAVAPILFLRRKATMRIRLFEEQFPEAIDVMARALRAGHTLPLAIQTVGEEIPAPVGPEFRLLFDQQNFGLSLPEAMTAFARRTPLVDAKFFVTAVLTQREMGGNLSEVLENLAAVIRERFKVKRHVRAVSAHGRITGWVLGFLPPVVAGLLFFLSPEHERLLLEDPLGVYMVIGAVVLQCIGIFWIRRVDEVEY